MQFKKDSKVFVAGHNGMVGSAIVRMLKRQGYENILTATRGQLDLTNQSAVEEFFASKEIEFVFVAAARVGGIHANNTYPAQFIYDNLQIPANIINSSHRHGVKRLLYLGSSCIYPKFANQPISEESLLTGQLEPTNEPYAIAKIGGIKLCESYNRQYGTDYRSLMPTNLYGINDNFDLNSAHVLPALMRKAHEAKLNSSASFEVWGTGSPKREFMHVDDLADACFHMMKMEKAALDTVTTPMCSHLNAGTGQDISIKEVAELIAEIVGFKGEIKWDSSKPDGTPRKLLNVDRMKRLGWESKISLIDGIRSTYDWFCSNSGRLRL